MSKDRLRRTQQRALLPRILGRVAYHQKYSKCARNDEDVELSREHGIVCANVTGEIEAAFGGPLLGNTLQRRNQATVIDIRHKSTPVHTRRAEQDIGSSGSH